MAGGWWDSGTTMSRWFHISVIVDQHKSNTSVTIISNESLQRVVQADQLELLIRVLQWEINNIA